MSSSPSSPDALVACELESAQFEASDDFGAMPIYIVARRLHLLGARLEFHVRPLRYASMLTDLALRAMLALASAHSAPDARTRRRYLARAHEKLLRYRTTLEAMFDRRAIGSLCLAVGMRAIRTALDLLVNLQLEGSGELVTASPATSKVETPANHDDHVIAPLSVSGAPATNEQQSCMATDEQVAGRDCVTNDAGGPAAARSPSDGEATTHGEAVTKVIAEGHADAVLDASVGTAWSA